MVTKIVWIQSIKSLSRKMTKKFQTIAFDYIEYIFT